MPSSQCFGTDIFIIEIYTFIRYTQNQKIRKPNNKMSLGPRKLKVLYRIPNRIRPHVFEGGEP
jgi:hypothetical protein